MAFEQVADPLDALAAQHGALAGAPGASAAAADPLDALAVQHGAEPSGGAMTFAIVNGQRVPVDSDGPPSWMDLAKTAVAGWASGMNPLPALEAMYGETSKHLTAADVAAQSGQYGEMLKQNAAAVVAPGVALASAVIDQHLREAQKAKDAFRKGQLSEAIAHTVAAIVPIAGPLAAQAGEMIGTGDPRTMARGIGVGAAALTPSALKYGAEVARTGSLVPTPGKVAAAAPVAVNVPALARNPNPAEAAATDFGLDRGIPVDAGTATGSPVVRGTRYLADRSLGGAAVNAGQAQRQAGAFTRVGGQLADAAHPTPVVPTQAGEGVRSAISDLIDQFHETANGQYDTLRTLSEDPARASRFPTAPAGSAAERAIARKIGDGLGTDTPPSAAELREVHRILAEMENLPFTPRTWNWREGEVGLRGNAAGGHADIVPGSAGAPVYDDILQAAPGTSNMTRGEVIRNIRSMLEDGRVTNAGRGALDVARARLAGSSAVSRPVLPPDAGAVAHPLGRMESMGLPVDLKMAKTMLRPVADQMHRQLPLTQAQANPGLKAIDNILSGPDYAPLGQVDRDLSAMKAVARSQGGLAKLAVKHLDQAVRDAATKAGPDVLQALETGRAATVAKYGAQAVLDKLRDEPRQVFDQLTRPKDTSVEQLKAVAELAPSEMPKIGRAVLEDLLQGATDKGGFSNTDRLYARWQGLGPQTKQILFGEPALVHDLDRFFLLAKKAAENPNPSGSGYMVSLAGQGELLIHNPVAGTVAQVGLGALAGLLRSQRFVRALTQGFQIPLTRGMAPAASVAFSQITRAAESAGMPLSLLKAAEGPQPQPPTRVQR